MLNDQLDLGPLTHVLEDGLVDQLALGIHEDGDSFGLLLGVAVLDQAFLIPLRECDLTAAGVGSLGLSPLQELFTISFSLLKLSLGEHKGETTVVELAGILKHVDESV